MDEQGSPPPRASRQAGSGHRGASSDRGSRDSRPRRDRPGRPGWDSFEAFGPDTDADLPPWAGPAGYPARPTSTLRRSSSPRDPYADGEDDTVDPTGTYHLDGEPEPEPEPELAAAAGSRMLARRRGRAAATRLRKSRRRVYRWCGVAIVACIIAAGITALVTHHPPKKSLYVTSLLPGEFKSVPSACGSVSTSVLDQYVPEPGRTSSSELSGSTDSQCSFTVDRKPVFLVLEVAVQAFQPFAAATGSGSAAGSASANAQDNYAQEQQQLTKPAKLSPLSSARVTALPKTGQQAFTAVQREHVSGIITEVVTVVIRERNVLIVVAESGQESGHGFGPVSAGTLEAGAQAAARNVLASAMKQPTA